MATKNEVTEQGKRNAELVVNNQRKNFATE